MIWNWGFACSHLCSQWHCCSNELCRSIFDDNHRAIQHGPRSRCYGHDVRLLGMNILDPTPLSFPETSSVEDTQNGCRRYKVRPPSLNASLFRDLLKGTALNPDLQASLVRGWKEGFMLGSHLPPSNHFVPEALNRPLEQTEVLRKGLEKEKKLGRLHGPIMEPYYDNRWFKNHWISPYFAIPKKTLKGLPKKWRLIHHLSFHISGEREASFNSHIDINEYPTYFPTAMTGVHLVFCLSPPGSALAGRDVRDYYRNFLVNPYCWWQTYIYVLGSYFFNPYLPFGASSCTSIAQRQSDALRAAAKVYGVPGKSVAILDDFLFVCPRRDGETDASILDRGDKCETSSTTS